MVQHFVDTRDMTRARFDPTPSRSRRLRLRRAQGRATPRLERLRRAAFRQVPMLLLCATVAAAGGALFVVFSQAAPLAIAAWSGFGFAVGAAVAMARELGRNTVGGWYDIRRYSGYSLLGSAPELAAADVVDLPPDRRNPVGCLQHQPESRFASAIRDLTDEIAGDQLVAFVGSLPNDGATTAALCVAVCARQMGRRVLVIDCDLRQRSLSRALNAADRTVGTLDVATKPKLWREIIEKDEEAGIAFIPAARGFNPWRNLFNAPGLRILFDRLRDHYDLIVLDCPPALNGSDGSMIARIADRCVIVTAWDETPISALRATRRLLQDKAPVATSVYLNRAPSHQGARGA